MQYINRSTTTGNTWHTMWRRNNPIITGWTGYFVIDAKSHDTQNTISFICQDVSNYPQVFNQITIDNTASNSLPVVGDYDFTAYASTSNSVTGKTDTVVGIGFLRVTE